MQIATPLGTQHVELAISSADGVVRGVATQGDENVSFDEPVIEGAHLRWSQRISKPLSLLLHFDVTVEGDRMAGSAKAGRLPASTLRGERIG